MFTHCRNNMEWPQVVKAEVFVIITLLWCSIVVNIDYIPFLIEFVLPVMHLQVSVCSVLAGLDSENLSFLVNKHSIYISEELPPS